MKRDPIDKPRWHLEKVNSPVQTRDFIPREIHYNLRAMAIDLLTFHEFHNCRAPREWSVKKEKKNIVDTLIMPKSVQVIRRLGTCNCSPNGALCMIID